jgi:hypothetical protein
MLVKTRVVHKGYQKATLSLAACLFVVGFSVVPVKAMPPSFDCRKASSPDEFAICGSRKLSELDHIVVAGFDFARLHLGKAQALSIARPLLGRRHACGHDQGCILRRQIDAIRPYQRLGVPILLPQWAANSTVDSGSSARPERGSDSSDQSELVTQLVAVNGYRLLSRVSQSPLDLFSCEKSDYQNMRVCANEKKTGSGRKQIYRRMTLTFNQDTGQLFYIFSRLTD